MGKQTETNKKIGLKGVTDQPYQNRSYSQQVNVKFS